jgi:hypothetical protein
MLYQMLTGEIPRVMFKLPSRCRPELGTRFDALICKALETDPAERFQSAAEFRRELESASSPPAPSRHKSMSPLRWAAIPVAAVILSIAVFLVMRSGKRAGSALEEASHVRLEPGALRLWDAPEKVPTDQPGVRWEKGAARLDNAALTYPGLRARDAAVRADILMNSDRSSPSINLRHREAGKGQAWCYALNAHAKDGSIKLESLSPGKRTPLREWPLPRTYGPEEWLTLELRAVDDQLTVSADGKVLGTVRDRSVTEAGTVMLWATEKGYFRNIVFVPLENPIAYRIWDTPDTIPKRPGISWKNGAMHLDNTAFAPYSSKTMRDVILRAEVFMNPDSVDAQIGARWRYQPEGDSCYRVVLNRRQKRIELQAVHPAGKPHDVLGVWPLPRAHSDGDWVPIEIKAIGEEITVSADGAVLGTVHDSSEPQEGGLMAYAKANGYFRNVTFVPIGDAK